MIAQKSTEIVTDTVLLNGSPGFKISKILNIILVFTSMFDVACQLNTFKGFLWP